MTTIGPIGGNDSCTSEPERELEGGAEMDRVSELLGRPRRNEERPSDVTVQLFQLTAQGRTLRDTLRPWIASYQRDTVAASAWLVADASGSCLAIFAAEGTWTRASVRAKR